MKLFAWETWFVLVGWAGVGYGDGVRLTGTSSTPFGISAAQRAYAAGGAGGGAGVGAVGRVGPGGSRGSDSVEVSAQGGAAGASGEVTARRETNLSRLVAGVVSGRVEFDENGVAKVGAGDALSMYRRPADRNAAATGVSAGRLIDVRG